METRALVVEHLAKVSNVSALFILANPCFVGAFKSDTFSLYKKGERGFRASGKKEDKMSKKRAKISNTVTI